MLDATVRRPTFAWRTSGLCLFAAAAMPAHPYAAPANVRLADVYAAASAPESGLAIGMAYDAAERMLTGAGFARGRAASNGCLFGRLRADHRVQVILSTGAGRCEAGQQLKLVTYYRYRSVDRNLPTAPAELAGVNRRVGEEARCNLVNNTTAYCNWNDPARFPALSKIDLDVTGNRVAVTLRAREGPAPRPSAAAGGAFDPRAAIRELDPAAPGGVRLGAPLSEVAARLAEAGYAAAGYGKEGSACQWRFTRFNEVDVRVVVTPELRTARGSRKACLAGAVVRNVSYHKVDTRPDVVRREPESAQVMEGWRRRLSAPGDPRACRQTRQSTGTSARCDWTNLRGLASASLRHSVLRGAKATADVTLIGPR